jgi:hypothetical protein
LSRRASLGALAGYLVCSVALLGRGVLHDPTGRVVGSFGQDQGFFAWALVWWPHAIASGLDPVFTDVVYAPDGFNLAWATVIPGPALVLAPVTLTLGPIAAYNVLALAAPALAAWTAFLLCRRLTGQVVPALAGGWVFGFSSYELGESLNHVNLALVFPIPLAVLLVVDHLQRRIPTRRFVVYLGAVLFALASIFLETFLTFTLFAAAALVLALLVCGPPERSRLLRGTLPAIGLAYVGCLAVASPYLLAAVLRPNPISHLDTSIYSADVENFLFPTAITAIAHVRFAPVAARFTGNVTEQLAYLGPGLLAIVVLFAADRGRTRTGRFLLLFAALAALCSLGPRLIVGGIPTIDLPWRAMLHLPLVRYTLPARFVVYLWLALAVIVAVWLAPEHGRPGWRLPAAALALVLLLPTLHGPWWSTAVPTPPFFEHGRWRTALRPGENVLVIPYGVMGNSMLWQARTQMGFKLAGGYAASVIPKPFLRYPIVQTLYSGQLVADAPRELRRFLRDKRVTAIVVQQGIGGPWRGLFDGLARPRFLDGVIVYRLAPL